MFVFYFNLLMLFLFLNVNSPFLIFPSMFFFGLSFSVAGAVFRKAQHHRQHCDHFLLAGVCCRGLGLPCPRMGICT